MNSENQSSLSAAAAQILGANRPSAAKLNRNDLAVLGALIDRELAKQRHDATVELTRTAKVNVIATVAKHLLAEPGMARLALILLRRTPRVAADRPPIVFLRLDAILATEGQRGAAPELERLLTTADLTDGFRLNLCSRLVTYLKQGKLEIDEQLHRLLWGEVASDMISQLQHLRDHAAIPLMSSKSVEALLALRPDFAGTEDVFRQRLQWSALANLYLSGINYARRMNAAKTRDGGALTKVERQILRNSREQSNLAEEFDNSLLLAAKAEGHSIMILQSHGDMRGFVRAALASIDLPLSFIGNGKTPPERPGDLHLSTSNEADLPFGFAKLAKLMRKGPRLVRIFPDGHSGSEVRTVDVLGTPVDIRMGGAMLAYFGNAALFFASTRWTGKGFAVDLLPGPVIAKGTSREDCYQMFADFYAACMRKIVLGAPEDMGLVGGMWQTILQRS